MKKKFPFQKRKKKFLKSKNKKAYIVTHRHASLNEKKLYRSEQKTLIFNNVS